MNCSPQLTAKEFSDIHNAKCELHGVLQQMEGVVHPKLKERFEKALAQINKALENAYAQDDAAYEKNSTHYDAISDERGFKTIWSIHEVADLNSDHPYAGATLVTYEEHWGPNDVTATVNGKTWADLWSAADAVIKQSGDNHHVFIEGFTPSLTKPGVLVLSTGS